MSSKSVFNNIQSELLDQIQHAKSSLKIAVTWFTNLELFDALLKKLDDASFNLELIVLNDRINNKAEGADFQKLVDKNGSFYYSYEENMVHHKFCIIDDEIVITGSYNWTYYAESRNWENIVCLHESSTVSAYVLEFEKIKASHEKISNVEEKKILNTSMNSNEYLESDYFFQAKNEQKEGNNIQAAKLYTEILKLNNGNSQVVNERNLILKSYNNNQFEISPFEIGIHFKGGYRMVIPAFSVLPFNILETGSTVVENQSAVNVKIQKNDITVQNVLVFKFEGLKPSPIGTEKVEFDFSLSKHGILHVRCKELNGYGNKITKHVDIKEYL